MELENAIVYSQKRINKMQFYMWKYPLRKLLQKKKFHTFCIGTPKSGTHSIAEIFSNYRTVHEADPTLSIFLLKAYTENSISEKEIKKILFYKDNFFWPEIESSHFNGAFAPLLLEVFPKAKFILTIRDCYSWLDSWWNHQLSRKEQTATSIWSVGRDLYYQPNEISYSIHEKILKEKGLYSIDGYLSFWANHNKKVINSIPADKLLIVKTNEISQKAEEIANFLNISIDSLDLSKSHSFRAKKKFNLLERLDQDFLEEKMNFYCSDLMEKHFPEVLNFHSK